MTVSTAQKAITVDYNGNAAYVPLDAAKLETLKADIKKALGASYANYKVVLKSGKSNLDELALFAPRKT